MKIGRKTKLLAVILAVLTAAAVLLPSGCSVFGSYSISYVMNDSPDSAAYYAEGESNPEIYFSGAGAVLSVPLRDGYAFDGWYETEDFSGSRITSIAADARGDITLYAKWTEYEPTGYVESGSGGLWSDELTYMWRGFMPYVEKFDNAYNTRSTVTLNSRDELTAYMEYVQYRYISQGEAIGVKLDYSYADTASDEIRDAYRHAYFASYVGLAWSETEGCVKLFINYEDLASNEASKVFSTTDALTQIAAAGYSERGGEHEFAIYDARTVLTCETSNQLFYAAMIGAEPAAEKGSAAESILLKAEDVLTRIVADGMSDRSKALAIYEWLIMHVCYDETVYDEAEETDITVAETAEYEAFYLEGVFDSGRAVCDGISKAMVLLCRMEGIPCVRVAGDGHAWNKVFLDGKWYVADATFGDTGIEINGTEYSFMTHKYFMTSDTATEAYQSAVNYTSPQYTAGESAAYKYYESSTFVYENAEYDFVIDNLTEYNALKSWARSLDLQGVYSIDFYYSSYRPPVEVDTGVVDGNYASLFFNV